MYKCLNLMSLVQFYENYFIDLYPIFVIHFYINTKIDLIRFRDFEVVKSPGLTDS